MRGVPTKRSSGVPQRGHAGLLPAGYFCAKGGIACREVLRAVVALPGACVVFGAARAHAARGAPAFVKHMHLVARLNQGLRR